jgi:hypothetical protein
LTSDIDNFMRDFDETGEGEYHVTIEELAKNRCSTKQEHQEYIITKKISMYNFDQEKLTDLFSSIKYPGEY